jgi:hypothetical protein
MLGFSVWESIMGHGKLRFVVQMQKSAICIGVLSLLTLGGCSRVRVRLGQRVELEKIPMASMDARLADDPAIVPGQKAPLIATLTATDGTLWTTEGRGKGKILWKDLVVTTTLVSANKKGIISLSSDPRVSDGKTGHVIITAPTQPALRVELEIPLRYDYHYRADFTGSSGSSGLDGTAGSDGISGAMGSIEPEHPSAGGNGSSGSGGSNGQSGSAGSDAPPIQVRVAVRAGSHPLLQLGVSASGYRERFYLVDPQGGSLTVHSSGGSGGSGGKGGRGGRGGAGGVGLPSGSSGSDGTNGLDGTSGSSGNAGSITLIYDPKAKSFLSTVNLVNPGGPAPVLKEEQVAPLW